jgi:4-amino-4-deoxy-L-arabinose transferase-like glycosyltransferase
LALALAAVLRWPLLVRPLQDLDEPNFASIAALCQGGGALYADGGVDNKPPAIFWVYQLAFTLGGRYAMRLVHLLAIVAVLATAYLLAQVARRLGGARAAFWAALLYGVFSMAPDPRVQAANTENFMMLPLAAAVWIAVQDRWPRWLRLAGVGASIAVACLCKQIALVSLGVALVAVATPAATGRARPRSFLTGAAACALGFALPLAGVAAWLAAHHTLGAALHWTVTRLSSHYGPSAWSIPIRQLLADGALRTLLFALATLPLCLAAILRLRDGGERSPAERMVVAWLLVSALGVIAGGHFFDHYFIQLIGPLAVLGGLYIAEHARPTWDAGIGLFAVGLMLFAASCDGYDYRPFWRHPKPDYGKLAQAIRSRTRDDERIFVWGNAPAIYVLSDRLPATRFVGFLRGLRRSQGEAPQGAWDAGPEVWPLLADDFARHAPALIVDTSTGDYRDFRGYPMSRFPAVQALVASGYARDGEVEGATLYRRVAGER